MRRTRPSEPSRRAVASQVDARLPGAHMRAFVLFGVLTLVTYAPSALAQDTVARNQEAKVDSGPDLPIVPSTGDQVNELTAWIKKATEWQKWDQRYRGVAQWNWAGQPAERKAEPEAPVWLSQACVDFREGRITATQLLLDGCALRRSLGKDNYDVVAEQILIDPG